ncbi:MAG TPA: hypothetical protein VIZ17_14340 [Acetobacteraceae bacterium]
MQTLNHPGPIGALPRGVLAGALAVFILGPSTHALAHRGAGGVAGTSGGASLHSANLHSVAAVPTTAANEQKQADDDPTDATNRHHRRVACRAPRVSVPLAGGAPHHAPHPHIQIVHFHRPPVNTGLHLAAKACTPAA